MEFNPINDLYNVKEAVPYAPVGFRLLWKVDEDPRYQVHQSRGFNGHSLFYTYEGRGIFRFSPGETYSLKPYSLFILEKHKPCYYECPAGGFWKFYFITFESDVLLKSLGLKLNALHESADAYFLKSAFESIVHEMITKRPGYLARIESVTAEMFISFARAYYRKPSPAAETLDEVRLWIHNHVSDKIDLDQLLSRSGLGRTQFFNAFRKLTGRTPVQYWIRLKLESAAAMLSTTQRKIKDIAAALNFYDEYYFSRMFKAEYGTAPGRFRAGHAD